MRLNKTIKFILITILLFSCKHEHTLSIENFDKEHLRKYLLYKKNINIETECGLIKDVKLLTSDNKIININIFIKCNFYTGDLNLSENKEYTKSDNSIFINTMSNRYTFNDVEYSLDKLKNKFDNKIDKKIDIYIIRSNWSNVGNLDKFIKTIYNNCTMTFEYRNLLYEKSNKVKKVMTDTK